MNGRISHFFRIKHGLMMFILLWLEACGQKGPLFLPVDLPPETIQVSPVIEE